MGTVFGLGSMYLTEYLFILFILLFLIVGCYTFTLKCPKCGKCVLHNPIKLFGIEFYIWTSWVPKKCTKCNFNL